MILVAVDDVVSNIENDKQEYRRQQLSFKLIQFDETPLAKNMRTVILSDYEEIGRLDLITIKNGVEFNGETEKETIKEMKLTFNGKYGQFLPEVSFVITEDDKIISAVIWTKNKEHGAALLAYAMTHPEYQRHDLAKTLLMKSSNALLELGYKKAVFGIMHGNTSSMSLFNSLKNFN